MVADVGAKCQQLRWSCAANARSRIGVSSKAGDRIRFDDENLGSTGAVKVKSTAKSRRLVMMDDVVSLQMPIRVKSWWKLPSHLSSLKRLAASCSGHRLCFSGYC